LNERPDGSTGASWFAASSVATPSQTPAALFRITQQTRQPMTLELLYATLPEESWQQATTCKRDRFGCEGLEFDEVVMSFDFFDALRRVVR
jgi:hypothetical protein